MRTVSKIKTQHSKSFFSVKFNHSPPRILHFFSINNTAVSALSQSRYFDNKVVNIIDCLLIVILYSH